MTKEAALGSCPNASPRLDNTVTNGKQKLLDLVYKTEPQTAQTKKVILSGHFIETYEFEKPIITNRRPGKKKKEIRPELIDAVKTLRRKEYRQRTKHRVRGAVQRLVESNFDKNSIFLTLTFNNENKFDITDLKVCNSKFNYFMKKLKKEYMNLKYLAVPEFQNRGAVHYHAILNVPFINKELIQKMWGYGFIKIKDINYIEGIGNYFTKYLVKNCDDTRLEGRRSYFTSKNLRRSKIAYGEHAEKIIGRLEKNNIKPYFANQYESDFNGVVKYRKYHINGKI